MGALAGCRQLLETTFVVIDFEGTTPRGHPPQPIEVAALALVFQPEGGWQRTGEFSSLMRPPEFAPITPMGTRQTGITAAMLATAPAAGEVFAALDARMKAGPYLLVAHHASVEGGMIFRHRDACSVLASTDLIDTIPLAKLLLPGLADYRLDTLLAHYKIPRPADRHRALADVKVTAEVFGRLIADADATGALSTLEEVWKTAGRRVRAPDRAQDPLF